MHARVVASWHDVGMDTMTAERDITFAEIPAPAKARPAAACEPAPRLPVAAGLLPYGLTLASLLQP